MKTYQVTLPDEVAEMVDRMLAAGGWPSADELFAAGVATLDLESRFDDDRTPEETAALRRELQKGIDQLDRGEGIDGEEFMAQLIAKAEARAATAKQPT